MIVQGILNPHVLSLLARVRHTNMLVIADRGFPFWPMIETVDLSLVDGVPTVLQVLAAVRQNFVIGEAYHGGGVSQGEYAGDEEGLRGGSRRSAGHA
jgi:D-ribose pyranase